jgi:hypothetical protein
MHQKQLQQQQQQPKASPNQLHSNEQQQAADLQNSQSLDSQILATSETSQLRTEACNDGLIQGGDAFWRSSSCQVHSSSKVLRFDSIASPIEMIVCFLCTFKAKWHQACLL